MTLLQKDAEYVWHPFTQAQTAPTPIPLTHAKDAWLYAQNDKKYIDANSSWWTVLHGHGNEHIAQSLADQFKVLDHAIFAGATHPKAVEIAERIVGVLPDGFSKVFFSDNGSTSVEVAIKMCYQYWHNKGEHKKRFLAIEGSYHGDTFGAMSVGQRGYFNKPFEHLFFDVDFIPFPTEDNIDEVLKKMEDLFRTGEFAGFIFEPLVQGAAGMRMYQPEWLEKFVQLANQYDVLAVADEVMTGFYRTGKMFAINHIESKADIVCLSKGLTGGVMALGLTVASQKIYDAFLSDEIGKALLHGHSFTGNPLACTAACASLDVLESAESQQRVESIVNAHTQFVEQYKDSDFFKSVKSQGTILSLEVNVGEESSYFSSIRTEAYNHFLDNEILLRPLGNVIFLNPPYCITENELNHVYQQIIEFLEGWFRK